MYVSPKYVHEQSYKIKYIYFKKATSLEYQ